MSEGESEVVCPNCDSSVRIEARFCDQCGWSLNTGRGPAGYDATHRVEVAGPREASEEALSAETGFDFEEAAEDRTEPHVDAEPLREHYRNRVTFREMIGGSIWTFLLWSGSPLLLLAVLVGAVARDNFRKVDSSGLASLQGESVGVSPEVATGLAFPLDIVTPFLGVEKTTDFETVNDSFERPRGIAISDGFIYVVDPSQSALFILDGDGGQIGQVLQSDRRFVEPVDVATDAAGNVYVLDAGDGGQVSLHGSDGEFLEVVPVPADAADRSRGLDVDSQGRIWLAMTPALAVAAFDLSGQELIRISTGFEGADLQPVDVVSHSEGFVFVSTAGMTSVLRFTEAGELLNLWPLVTANSVDGPHLALDSRGMLFVTQPEQGGIMRISVDDAEDLEAWVLPGSQPLRKLVGITADGPGSLLVTDSENGNVYRLQVSP